MTIVLGLNFLVFSNDMPICRLQFQLRGGVLYIIPVNFNNVVLDSSVRRIRYSAFMVF